MIKINHMVEKDNKGYVELDHAEPYIIFTINNEEFGVEVQRVLELVKYTDPLTMPNNFINVQGMTVFRGKIIPVVDLRKIFGLEPVNDGNTVTIVVESRVSDFGIIAERVLDINYIPENNIKKITAFNFGDKTKYLKSVANIGGRLILLIDLEKMVEPKPNQTAIGEVMPEQSATKLESPSVWLPSEVGSQSVLENNYGTDLDTDFALDGRNFSPAKNAPELEEAQKESLEETKLIGQFESSQTKNEEPSSYLIDRKELEDLLKEIEPEPEEVVQSACEAKGFEEPVIDSMDLMDSERIESILAELEWGSGEAQETHETDSRIGLDLQIEQQLSKEAIEEILKELEAMKETAPDDDNQELKIDRIETLEEKAND